MASMVAPDTASTLMSPLALVEVTPASTSAMKAATPVSTSLNATPMPIDRLAPTAPTAAATETAPVIERMVELSSALTPTLAALMPRLSLSPCR